MTSPKLPVLLLGEQQPDRASANVDGILQSLPVLQPLVGAESLVQVTNLVGTFEGQRAPERSLKVGLKELAVPSIAEHEVTVDAAHFASLGAARGYGKWTWCGKLAGYIALWFVMAGMAGCDEKVRSCANTPSESIESVYVKDWNKHRIQESCRVPEDKEYPLHICKRGFSGSDYLDQPQRWILSSEYGYKMVFYTKAKDDMPTGWVLKKGQCDHTDLNCESHSR